MVYSSLMEIDEIAIQQIYSFLMNDNSVNEKNDELVYFMIGKNEVL